ncbi:hypothetical protein D3C84_1229360 [compost metagenome]
MAISLLKNAMLPWCVVAVLMSSGIGEIQLHINQHEIGVVLDVPSDGSSKLIIGQRYLMNADRRLNNARINGRPSAKSG